ncbi:hypothetical protein [Botrimarina mediterranea]|uniref:Uncharacterized protein n=1 Tax=Botrimarina mediterranea TaxID=2528022 RepID=A0A518K930_9BACT|nr:hypothetical protein [Botrimarina mediterranea]QDV74305.1 hypothetical protein Spa11_25060 [Botrimarina mediterranea]
MSTSPWPALNRLYGPKGDSAAVLNAAIAAEEPGGAALLDALQLANTVSKWDDNAMQAVASHTQMALLEATASEPLAPLAGAAELAKSMPYLNNPKALHHAHEALRLTLKTARDLLVERVLERHANPAE